MPTLRYAGALLIAISSYPLYQAGTVQAAETQHQGLSIRVGLTGQSTVNPSPGQDRNFMLASMNLTEHSNHTDAGGALEQKVAKPDMKATTELTITKPVKPDKHVKALQCLALNIYFEARGESEQGKRAVGHVVMNRLSHRKFPNSVCAVVQQGGAKQLHRCQFSWWCDGRSDTPRKNNAWNESIRIAREIHMGNSTDPTGGALWYHAEYVSPYWRTAFQQGPKIGQHIFYLATR